MAKKQSKKKYLRVVILLVFIAMVGAVTYALYAKNTLNNNMTIREYLGCNRVTADGRDTDIFCSDAGIALYRRGHVTRDDFPPNHYQEQGFDQFKAEFERIKSKADCLVTHKGDYSQCS